MSNAGKIVELPYSIHVFATFMFGADFKVFGFLSFALPDKWCENPTHWEIGIFKAFGNF